MVSENGLGHADGLVLAKETFPGRLSSLTHIRAFVKRWAEEAGVDAERIGRLQLAVTEACANAIEHPKEESDVALWAWNRADRFTVDVWHASEFRVKDGQERGHRGMGLPLMVASADEVSFACLPEGGTRVSLSVFLK
jgi:anti-sigma regulatory factor (Ser/Thr protein kinase)